MTLTNITLDAEHDEWYDLFTIFFSFYSGTFPMGSVSFPTELDPVTSIGQWNVSGQANGM